MSDNITVNEWKKAQVFEKDWHSSCTNSYHEETKQQVYAKRMGLTAEMVEGKFPVYDLKGKVILDIGGGAYSLLLKCINAKGWVIDPCDYPSWTVERYKAANIHYKKVMAESFIPELNKYLGPNRAFDEVWIYNVLQHTQSPKKIIENAKHVSRLIRIFEWIDNGISPGHPQDLKEDKLNDWLGGIGKVEMLNESGCNGKSYSGIFKGDHYEED